MSTLKFLLVCLVILASVLVGRAGPIVAQEADDPPKQSSYRVTSAVMGSAGAPGASASYQIQGTMGQSTPIGIGSAADLILYAGFWGKFWSMMSSVNHFFPENYENLLFQNFPNPFNPTTTLNYTVAQESPVEITIYNVQGQRVRTLVRDTRMPGRYFAVWDGTNDGGQPVATGMYFYRMKVGKYTSVKKMLMLK